MNKINETETKSKKRKIVNDVFVSDDEDINKAEEGWYKPLSDGLINENVGYQSKKDLIILKPKTKTNLIKKSKIPVQLKRNQTKIVFQCGITSSDDNDVSLYKIDNKVITQKMINNLLEGRWLHDLVKFILKFQICNFTSNQPFKL